MAKKTTTKKTATTNATKKTPRKPQAKKTPAKKTPRMSASAARAEGVAKTKRAVTEPAKVDAARRKQDGGKDPVAKIAAKADRKPSGLDLAAKVLVDGGEPLKAKQIAERSIAAGWKTNGKTPEATLYAAMTREIAKKGDAARFRKADRGLFEVGPGAKPTTKKGA